MEFDQGYKRDEKGLKDKSPAVKINHCRCKEIGDLSLYLPLDRVKTEGLTVVLSIQTV